MPNIIIQSICALFSGMTVGFEAFFQAVQLYNQIDSIKTTIISLAIGVPVSVITVVIIIAKKINRLSK
ncbi:MAG: hypothetical protein J5955_03935 [Bacilli bacterium]|nr:hypothetical protein [Bacilli bacterium]